MIARVVVDVSIDREFDYSIPENLLDMVKPGCRVRVPFGRKKTCGYVMDLVKESAHSRLRDIEEMVNDSPMLDKTLLSMARWMARYYCATLSQAVRVMVPAPVRLKKFKQKRYVSLTDKGEEATRASGAQGLSEKQRKVISSLRDTEGMFLDVLLKETGTTESPVKSLLSKGLVRITRETSERSPLSGKRVIPVKPHCLMSEQSEALSLINRTFDSISGKSGSLGKQSGKGGVVLLHGVTGSGKTEVYIQAIDYVLGKGNGAIVLVPEISLTPQTVERFVGRFGDRVAVLHSHLSDGERHDEWHRINRGDAEIVVGARSAVFAPVRNLGIIIVDEEHEPSYKQEDAPRYNARDVAVMRASLCGCAVVLGSATPSMESWNNARAGKYASAHLTKRVDDRKMPVIRVVDMRMEKGRRGATGVFSGILLEAMARRLERGEQTILFLNRRGFSTSLVCHKCGYVAKCRQCSVSCVYHRDEGVMRCHICGDVQKVPDKCPGCGDPGFKFSGTGTQRVEAIIKKCFPRAVVQRMDTDMTSRKGSYNSILGDFRAGKTDILIGTQMIAKGLHFPNVTLVGVVYADLSLHMPDFRASERTFQLLAQVAGRAGRGEVSGEVIVQTYTPFHYSVQMARRVDFDGFCDQEIEFRKELSYPPFSHLICVTVSARSDDKALFYCSSLRADLIKKVSSKVIVSDPAPAPIKKIRGKYRYQIMIRSVAMKGVADALMECVRVYGRRKDVDVAVDVDAMSLM